MFMSHVGFFWVEYCSSFLSVLILELSFTHTVLYIYVPDIISLSFTSLTNIFSQRFDLFFIPFVRSLLEQNEKKINSIRSHQSFPAGIFFGVLRNPLLPQYEQILFSKIL